MAHSPVTNNLESPIHPQSNYNYSSRTNGTTDRPPSQGTVDEEIARVHAKTSEEPRITRTKDPMSFSSILSSNVPDLPKAASRPVPASKQTKATSNTPNGDSKYSSAVPRKSVSRPVASPKDYATPPKRSVKAETDIPPQTKHLGATRPKLGSVASDKENEKVKKEMAKIDDMELSDIDAPEWESAKQKHVISSQKRQRDVEAAEEVKRKVS